MDSGIASKNHSVEILSTLFFGIALLHTFLVSGFRHLASLAPGKSLRHFILHLLGEVELVFGIWAFFFLACMAGVLGGQGVFEFLGNSSFTEPAFVLVIMIVAATRPVLDFTRSALEKISRILPFSGELSFLLTTLILGPLFGSFITEPAAMTVTALVLRDHYFAGLSERFRYLLLGTLFVGISVGGVLTPYAAPPVLMIAHAWSWDLTFMLTNFGWKVALIVVLNAALLGVAFCLEPGKSVFQKREMPNLGAARRHTAPALKVHSPLWLRFLHLAFLGAIVVTSHDPAQFFMIFLGFLVLFFFTKEYQAPLQIKGAALVAIFLTGLVILAAHQKWWLEPLLISLSPVPLFLGTTALTAVTDNATLTFLGAGIPGLADELKYFLVAGAIAGGGLTVVANAPNPAGYEILNDQFGEEGISALKLLAGAAIPTLIAIMVLGFLRP